MGPWLGWDEDIASEKNIEIPVQINGKLRTRLTVAQDTPNELLEEMVRSNEVVLSWVAGKSIVKVIIVSNKLVNVVVK